MKPNAPKVMFIGFDAASKDLVSAWAAEGRLPNFARLLETGARAEVVNAPAIYTGSVWPSIWSGATPGNHGCYYNEQLAPGSYAIADFLGRDVKREPFWNALSRAGRRVAVFDVPKAPLAEKLNGVQIVDWGTHDSDVPACSWPPRLIDDLTKRHGPSPFRRCDWVMDGRDPERTLRDQLVARIHAKVAIAEELLDRDAWDLFALGFGESHCIGHQCWHVHDPTHPAHAPELAQRLGNPLRDVYEALDAALGHLAERAGPETSLFVLCSHGMGAHYDASHLLDEVLRRLEGRPAPALRSGLDRARRLWKTLPLGFTERLGALARRVNRLPDADDRRSRACFVVPTNANAAGIRLNLVGREPDGKLRPGPEADGFVERLEADLAALVDTGDGRPLVRDVVRSRDAFPGEHVDRLPDLFVRWNRERPINGVASPKIGELVRPDTSTRRSGDHRPGGLLLVQGPRVSAGEALPAAAEEDLAPTLAAALGERLDGADGRSILP